MQNRISLPPNPKRFRSQILLLLSLRLFILNFCRFIFELLRQCGLSHHLKERCRALVGVLLFSLDP